MSENVIELEHVSFKYKGSEEGLLNDTSLTVTNGEALLLTGASGSGKTTILRLINGLIPHYYQGDVEGKVTVAGREIAKTELYELAGVVGTVFQNPRSQFFSIDTDGEIVFGPENIGLDPKEIQKRKEDVVEEMHIGKLLGRSLFELSGGEKQSIACASVSALLPEIILLDEPSQSWLNRSGCGRKRARPSLFPNTGSGTSKILLTASSTWITVILLMNGAVRSLLILLLIRLSISSCVL